MNRYRIKLTESEVAELHKIINKGKHSSQSCRAAYILLNVDEGEFSHGKSTGESICKVLKAGMRTIDRVKHKCIEGGMERALEREKSSRVYEKIIDGEAEAQIISIACSQPPPGYARRSLRMTADKAAELHYIEKISHVSIHKVLKKTNLNRGK